MRQHFYDATGKETSPPDDSGDILARAKRILQHLEELVSPPPKKPAQNQKPTPTPTPARRPPTSQKKFLDNKMNPDTGELENSPPNSVHFDGLQKAPGLMGPPLPQPFLGDKGALPPGGKKIGPILPPTIMPPVGGDVMPPQDAGGWGGDMMPSQGAGAGGDLGGAQRKQLQDIGGGGGVMPPQPMGGDLGQSPAKYRKPEFIGPPVQAPPEGKPPAGKTGPRRKVTKRAMGKKK